MEKESQKFKITVKREELGLRGENIFTFSINNQQYLDYIIPLLKDIQQRKIDSETF